MSTPALDENGLARLTLREIAREHGPAGLDSPQLLTTLLPDLLPSAPRENRLIIAAAQLGVAGLLASRMSLGLPVNTAISDIAARLAGETALDADASRWVVTEYAYVLGHGPEPRTTVEAHAAGVPVDNAVPPRPRPDSDPVPPIAAGGVAPVPPAVAATTADSPAVNPVDPAVAVTAPGDSPVSPAAKAYTPGVAAVPRRGAPPAPTAVLAGRGAGAVPVAPGGPPAPAPVSPTAMMPEVPVTRDRHRGPIIAAAVVAIVLVAGAVTYGLTRNGTTDKGGHGTTANTPGNTSTGGAGNGGGDGTTAAAPCVVGTWTETDEFLKLDKDGNPSNADDAVKLSRTGGEDVRVFNDDGTGTISVHDVTLEGDTDGHHLKIVFDTSEDGTLKWKWDGSTITYSEVKMPGSYAFYVDDSKVKEDSGDPLYENGDASLSCDGDHLKQSGDGYERDYDRS